MKQRNPEANCGNCPAWYAGDCACNPQWIEKYEDTPACMQHPDFFLPEVGAPNLTPAEYDALANQSAFEQAVIDAAERHISHYPREVFSADPASVRLYDAVHALRASRKATP